MTFNFVPSVFFKNEHPKDLINKFLMKCSDTEKLPMIMSVKISQT